MDIRKVKKLIELLEESGIAEIEISEGEESVRISRYPAGGAGIPAPMYHYAAPATAPTAVAGSGPSRIGRPGQSHIDAGGAQLCQTVDDVACVTAPIHRG